MNAVEVATQIRELELDRDELEAKLAELEAEALALIEVKDQAVRLGKRDKLRREIESVDRAIGAARRLLAVTEAEESQARAVDWRVRLHPEAVGEITEAQSAALALLKECKETFDRWTLVHRRWSRQWEELGKPNPGLPRVASSFHSWLTPSAFDPSTRALRDLLR